MDPVSLFAGIGTMASGLMGAAGASTATIGTAGLGAQAAAGALGALGAGVSGVSSAMMLGYQSGIAKTNANIDRQNAAYALQTGEQQAAQSGMKTRATVGHIITGEAASGFQVGSGTNADVVTGQETVGNLEQTAIRSGAAKSAYDYTVKSTTEDAQAKADSFGETMSLATTPLTMGASILGSAGSVASKWYGMQQNMGSVS